MQYPLQEQIGEPELFVGREKEFRNFGRWIDNIPRLLSKSRVILARRKSGKTAFVQRVFNQLWSANGEVIPFYFAMPENKFWYSQLAIEYYHAFASQYISFRERDPALVEHPLSLMELDVIAESSCGRVVIVEVKKIKESTGRRSKIFWKNSMCTLTRRLTTPFCLRFCHQAVSKQMRSNYVSSAASPPQSASRIFERNKGSHFFDGVNPLVFQFISH